jgi:lambda family phage portal protein
MPRAQTAAARRRTLPKSQGETPMRARAAVYESASGGRRAYGWLAPTLGPNQSVLDNLHTLRDRSRLAVRNDGYAKGVIDKLVYNIVGTGLKPLSLAKDAEARKAIQSLWTLWTDYSDADGLCDWYGQQSQAVRCWLEAGEVFVRLRDRRPEDGLPVPLQAQVLEPELCPHTYSTLAPNGNRIRAGIEFDRIGRRVAYYFYATRPGDLQDWDASSLRRVPADHVLHVYKPLRPGQLRGLPHLTQAMIRLRELDKFDDATLIRQQLAAMFVAFLKHPTTDSSSIIPVTDQTPVATDGAAEGDRPVLALQPGIFQELAAGEEVEFSKPPDVVQGYADFMRQQLFAVAAATGVPYEVLTGDMSKVNDRTVRVILHEFRRQIQCEQHQTVAFQFCRPVWNAWMDAVFLSGAFPAEYLADPEVWTKVQWMPQGWPYLHPVQDVEAQRAAIRAGVTSRSAVVSEQGEDSEIIDRQQAEDNKRADELGLEYDSDGRTAPPTDSVPPDERPGPTPGDGGTSEQPPSTEEQPPGPAKKKKAATGSAPPVAVVRIETAVAPTSLVRDDAGRVVGWKATT